MDATMLNFQKNALLGNISGTPLCGEYVKEWRSCGVDKESLVKLVLRQQSIPFFMHACYVGMGLDKDYLLTEFGEYINGNKVVYNADGIDGYTYALHVNHDGYIRAYCDVNAIMWSDAKCFIRQTKSPVLYIGNNSRIQLSLEGFNSPMVYLFDESEVYIDNTDAESSVIVYKYSDNADVKIGKYCLAKIKVFNKKLKL